MRGTNGSELRVGTAQTLLNIAGSYRLEENASSGGHAR